MAIDIVENPQDWIDEWQRVMNDDDRYKEAGEGWGVDFEGSFIFEVEATGGLEEPMYFYIEPVDGTIETAEHVENPDDYDWGFRYAGSYENWKKLIDGEIGGVDGLMSGAFTLDGDMQKVLQYSQAATIMTGAAEQIDTEFKY